MTHQAALDDHILNIIQNSKIFEQSDLQKLLKKRGYKIPQATLSRRLKKLKIAKVSGVYKVVDVSQLYLPRVLNMQISDFGLIVLHTHPGQAGSLAYFLDQKYVARSASAVDNFKILGTLAGDDTVLLILKNQTDLKKAFCALQVEFSYLQVV